MTDSCQNCQHLPTDLFKKCPYSERVVTVDGICPMWKERKSA